MTSDGKFCSFLSFYLCPSKVTRHCIFALSLISLSCTSTPKYASSSRSADQKEEIRNLVQSSKIIECRLNANEWTIPGDVGQAQVIKAENRWALIYEALLRSGPRTVYQPLLNDFTFNGDGIAMGLKGSPRVSDLKTFEDVKGHRWYMSRVKMNNSELYSGLVEVLSGGRNYRSVLPIPESESVQQIWPSLPIVSGYANIIVRSTASDDSGMSQDDDSVFRWFQVGLSDNSARLISSFKPRGESLQPTGFVSLENSGEPVAVTIVQPRIAQADAEPSGLNGNSKVSLRRIFSKSNSEKVIFEGAGNISGLTISDSTFYSGLHLAWIYSPIGSDSRYVQTTALPVRFIPERYFARGPLKDLEGFMTTELSYEANNPDFSFTMNNQNQLIPVLGWWGKLEKDVVLMMQVITPAFRKTRGQQLRTRSGALLGTSFQPSLAVVPPTQFNRVLFFSAAASQTEKSIMVLSNRGDSAEIAKESTVSSCFF